MPLSLVTAASSEPLTVNEVRRHLRLDDSDGEPSPTAPTVALATVPAAGNCDNGIWRIGLTFITATGETELGAMSAGVTVVDKTVNGQIAVTDIPVGGNRVTSRKVYALSPSASTAKYVGTIADNTTTTYTVNIAASSLGVDAPSTNTTENVDLADWITTARERGESATNRAFSATQTWDWFIDQFPYGCDFIEVPKPPLIAVTYVKYYDTAGTLQTLGSSNYLVTAPAGPRCARGKIALPFGTVWPVTLSQRNAVQIRFTCGYTTVPSMIRSAMKIDIGSFYVQREGVVDAQLYTSPNDAESIYRRYRSYPTQRPELFELGGAA